MPSPADPVPARRARLPTGLAVQAFSGVRYDTRHVGDLASVTSPPYDVMDRSDVLAHEDLEAHNVVRLVRPRPEGCGAEGPYAHAADLLRSWLAAGVLRGDGEVLYAYEQGRRGAAGWQRGVLGAVRLGVAGTSAVVPHEEVMPGPVQDRLALMDRTAANLEPILLLHEGPDDAGEQVESVLSAVCAGPPDASTVDASGRAHRVWVVPEEHQQRTLTRALGRRGALIADGHHRWAAYHALQRRRHDEGHGQGPWDAGLALLVDPQRYPLHLGAIHRTVTGLDARRAVADLDPGLLIAGPWSPSLPPGGPPRGAPGAGGPPVLVVDARSGSDVALRPGPDLPARLAELLPGTSVGYRRVPAALVHALLLPAWGVEEERVGYHHDVPAALAAARSAEGAAVLLPPTTLDTVVEVVAAGETMPRKSTSFGPKPLTGLVLRLLGAPPL